MTVGFFGYSLESNIALLVGAFAMAIGGAAFISRGLRMRRELVAERTALIALRPGASNAGVAGRTHAADTGLTRATNELDIEIVRNMKRIGVSAANAPRIYLAIRIASCVCMGALVLVLGGHIHLVAAHALLRLLLVAGSATAGWFLPLLILQRMMANRVKKVVSGLPDALELLVICAEAGLPLEEGIIRVTNELRRAQPELSEELALTSADLKILPNRDDALMRLADRIDQQNFRTVVTTLMQTMRYGTPLAQALRTVASEMRNESLIRLEERANRLPALLTVPMMLFILPTIFLIVGGPAILRLIDAFSH